MKDRKSYRNLFRSMKREWLWILKYVKLYKLNIFLYIALGLVATVMSLGTSVATKRLIDAVVSHSDDKILGVVCLVVGLTVLCHVFQALASWVTAVVSTKTNNEIRQEIYSNVVTSNWEDISSFHSGDLLNRLEGDASTVSSGIIGFIPNLITRSVQFFGALAIVLYYDKTMAVLALMSAPILFASSRFLLKTMRKFNLESRELNGKVLSYSEESMQNIQVIKAFDLTKQYTANFKIILENYRKVRLSYEKFSVLLSLCLSLLGTAVSYACYGWGVYRLWQGAITYGTMTLFLSISGTLNSSFNSLASLAPSAVSIATAAGRIMEITGYEKEKDEEREKALLLKKRSASSGVSVNFEDVSFTFKDADEPILRDICFSVNPGETIALIGPSGEGKTTVLKLVLGLLKPQKGRMYIEGESSQQIDISDSTRRFCSYVPQSVNVFTGTIADNLRMVRPQATDEELRSVLETADLWDFVSKLPDGVNTVIGERGANLSQGQAQRISIARALLTNSMILLLDEATSALDVETEKKVLENIMVSDPTRACIITTHRESMLKYCDRIYRVCPDGTMAKLNDYDDITV